MANKHGTTLVIVVLALLAVPGVFAAEYLGSAIIEPLADILGPQGWSGLYQSYPQLIEAILFTLFFGGLANKIVGERFGKMTAWALGLILAIALSVGMVQWGKSLADFGWVAALIVVLAITWFLYGVVSSGGENRVLGFAIAFIIGFTLLKMILPDNILKGSGAVFSWLGLVYAICIIIGLFGIFRMIAGSIGGGSGSSGGGFGFGGMGWGSGRVNTVDHQLDKAAASIGDMWNDRKEKARNMAAQVRTQFIGNLRGDVEKLTEAKSVSAGLRENIDRLVQYLTSVENTVKPTRVLGMDDNLTMAMRTYRQELAAQQGAVTQYYQQQDAAMQRLGTDLVNGINTQKLDAVKKSQDAIGKLETNSVKPIQIQITALKAGQKEATRLATAAQTSLTATATKVQNLRGAATEFKLDIGEGKAAQLIALHTQKYAPVVANSIQIIDAQLNTFTTELIKQRQAIDDADKDIDLLKKKLNQKEFKIISSALPSELSTMQQKVSAYLNSLTEKDYAAAVSSANIIIGNLQEFERFEPGVVEGLAKLASILEQVHQLETNIVAATAKDAQDATSITQLFYQGAAATHESIFALTAAAETITITEKCATALVTLQATSGGAGFDAAKSAALGELNQAESVLGTLITQVQVQASSTMAKLAKRVALPGGVADTTVDQAIQYLRTSIASLQTAVNSMGKIEDLKV